LLLRWYKMFTSEAVQCNTSLIQPTNPNPSVYTCFKFLPEHLRLLFWNAVLQRACFCCLYSIFLPMYKVACVEACFMMYQVFPVIHLFSIVCIQLWFFMCTSDPHNKHIAVSSPIWHLHQTWVVGLKQSFVLLLWITLCLNNICNYFAASVCKNSYMKLHTSIMLFKLFAEGMLNLLH